MYTTKNIQKTLIYIRFKKEEESYLLKVSY